MDIKNPITTLATQVVITKYGLDYQKYYAIIFSCLLAIVGWLAHNKFDFTPTWHHSALVGVVMIGGGIFWMFGRLKKRVTASAPVKGAGTKITIFNPALIKDIISYINKAKDNIKGHFNMVYGSSDGVVISRFFSSTANIQKLNHEVYGENESSIRFHDDELGYKGSISWYRSKGSAKKEADTYEGYVNSIVLFVTNIEGRSVSSEQFLHDVSEYVKVVDPYVTTYGYKRLKDCRDNGSQIMKIRDSELDELSESLYNSFFHPEKHIIWKTCMTVHKNPEFYHRMGQNPSVGYILYGPPGTGKSSLPYRVACATGRHIASIDIRTFSTKKDACHAFNDPTGDGLLPSRCVIVLDEFDMGILWLTAREKKSRQREKMFATRMEGFLECGAPYSPVNTRLVPITDNKDEEADEEAEGSDKEEDLDLSVSTTDDNFCTKDLLEIIQGVIPMNQAIIFATTNNYEKISEICPALFRPGRLEPIEFSYPDAETVYDMCRYHWGDELDFEIPSSHNVVPVEILTLIKKCKLMDEDFTTFSEKLRTLFY